MAVCHGVQTHFGSSLPANFAEKVLGAYSQFLRPKMKLLAVKFRHILVVFALQRNKKIRAYFHNLCVQNRSCLPWSSDAFLKFFACKFCRKGSGQRKDINNTQLSYKHWVSSKNRCTLDFKRMSATNEDFDSEEHYISFFFITYDLWWLSFRWVCVPLVPCRFRDWHSDLCQIFFVSN